MDALTVATFFLGGFLLGCALCSLVLGLLVNLHREDRDVVVVEREHWRSERRELLNRIQHPNLVPTGTAPTPRPQDPRVAERTREWAQVGRVIHAAPDDPTVELP